MKNRTVVGAIAILVVVGLVVAGLIAIGSPSTARNHKADQERRNRLSQLHFVLSAHVSNEGSLPAELDEVSDQLLRQGFGSDARRDPESGEFFEYRRVSDRRYEACAIFLTSTEDRRAQEHGMYPGDIEHEVGRNCYEQTVTQQDVDSSSGYGPGFFPDRIVPAPVRESPVPDEESPTSESETPAADDEPTSDQETS